VALGAVTGLPSLTLGLLILTPTQWRCQPYVVVSLHLDEPGLEQGPEDPQLRPRLHSLPGHDLNTHVQQSQYLRLLGE
jgi:hypothetical protein